MTRTLTADFLSRDAARNAMDELLADGIDREKIFLDPESSQLKVMVPEITAREITEILNRHNPASIH